MSNYLGVTEALARANHAAKNGLRGHYTHAAIVLGVELEKALAALKKHCQCIFEDGKLVDECHYHACQRTGRTPNGDPKGWISGGVEKK